MAGVSVISSHNGTDVAGEYAPAEHQGSRHSWYFTKDEIDNHSPSRKDGIDRTRESSLRKSYCSFLKDLGMKLQVGPVTTATAVMFCHQFYLRQSLAKTDWQTVATACMFLACKVEDKLVPLRDVSIVAYELSYRWDPSASERIRQREVYYKQKELILDAEHLLLVTIAFDICIQLPFRPLVVALKKLKISNNDVAKAAWNLVNEWLHTTLCLQYKPHYIAAGSLSVAAKLLNFRLPMDEGKPWWMQFDVSPKHLEEVTQQMLRYFKHGEKQRVPQAATCVSKATQKAEKMTSQITQSCALSGLTVDSDLKEKPTLVAGQVEKPFIKSTLDGATESRHLIKEASHYKSSDCCSAISGIMESGSSHSSSHVARVDDEHNKIDISRLKGAFERRKRLRCAEIDNVPNVGNDVPTGHSVERELEMGVECEYPSAVKKPKSVQVSMGS